MTTRSALDDLTILDLSHARAGPFASTMLATFGAAVIKIGSPGGGATKMVGPPARLSDTPGRIRSASPRLGEHTDQVLRDRLDLDQSEINRLRATGVIG